LEACNHRARSVSGRTRLSSHRRSKLWSKSYSNFLGSSRSNVFCRKKIDFTVTRFQSFWKQQFRKILIAFLGTGKHAARNLCFWNFIFKMCI